MTPRLQLAGRIAVFELGLAALVAVVVLSIPKPRPAPGFWRRNWRRVRAGDPAAAGLAPDG